MLGIKSDALNVLCIRWIWQEGRDERVFYLFPDSRQIYLNRDDIEVLSFFRPLFKYDKDQPTKVYLSDPIIDVLHGHQLEYDHTNNYLLEASSRGSFSFAFGHYIRDLLPYLIFSNNTISKIFSYKPVGRGEEELLNLLSMHFLERTHIGFESIPPASQLTPISLPYLRIYAIRAIFVYLPLATRLRILQDLSPPKYSKYSSTISNVLVLSRNQDYSTPANSQRWANESEFINYHTSSISISAVAPEKTGVTRLHNIIRTYRYDVIVSAFGSALYQIFLYPERYTHILILLGDLNDGQIWQSVLYDFYAFRHMFWILYAPASTTAPPNQLFTIPPPAIISALYHIGIESNLTKIIDIGGKYRLRPPEV